MKTTKIFALMILTVVLTGAVSSADETQAIVYSANSTADVTNHFMIGDTVYAFGHHFMTDNGNCNVYIMENGDWADTAAQTCPLGGTGTYCVDVGDSIPMSKVVAGPVSVPINKIGTNGLIYNTAIWVSDQTGEFDVVVDCKNSAGAYGTWEGTKTDTIDEPRDAVDLSVCIGLTVVPESVIAVGLIALLVPGLIYVARKKTA